MVAVLIISLAVTLLVTAVSAWADYKEAMNNIEMRSKEVEAIELPIIIENLWKMDLKTVGIALQGILHLQYIKHASIEANGKVLIEAGKEETGRAMHKEFPLFYSFMDKRVDLGVMKMDIGMSDVYKELRKNIWNRLLNQGILIFFISFSVFFIVQTMVTRHLSEIAAHVKKIGSINFEGDLRLRRQKHFSEEPDELDSIVNTVNSMNFKLKTSFDTLQGEITERKKAEAEREKLIRELRDVLANVKTLSGMLPICASCKKIRDDKGYWDDVASYITRYSEVLFSHGLCPDCEKKAYEELGELIRDKEPKAPS